VRESRDHRDPRRNAVSDDLDPGSDPEPFALAMKQRQFELPSMADEAVVNQEPFHRRSVRRGLSHVSAEEVGIVGDRTRKRPDVDEVALRERLDADHLGDRLRLGPADDDPGALNDA
jgi:hypothetical protein